VRLELEAESDPYPEIVFTDPRREHGWQVAMQPGDGPNTWYADVLLPQEPTLLSYYFLMPNGKVIREHRQMEGHEEPLFGVWRDQEYRISVYDPEAAPPEWTRGAVFYQIFPDRFAVGDPANIKKGSGTYGRPPLYLKWGDLPEHPPKGRDFYGGDLRGVTSKLDYLQDLGVSCIYFTPIFASPTNHRYDALDYTQIDPRLGTEEDLRELIAKAGERGIRVLLDGVFNHCSSDSIYFKAARADKLSPYYRWFNFTDWPDRWVGWLGVRTMPEFVECPEVEEFFFGNGGIAQRWLSLGTAGWRTDVTPWITDEFWRRFRRAVRRDYPDAYLIAEDWGDASHRLLGDSFDATMNYRLGYSMLGFAMGQISPAELDDRLETLRRDTPPPQFHAQMNLLDSHDTARALTRLGGSKQRLMLAVALQFAYPGIPTVFSGSEAGVEGSYAEAARRSFPWGHEDKELLGFYKQAISARRSSQALSIGDIETAWIGDNGGYGFLRRSGDETVLALFNNGDKELRAAIPLAGHVTDGEWPDLLGQASPAGLQGGTLHAVIPALGMGWFRAVG
jgi:glycosidase